MAHYNTEDPAHRPVRLKLAYALQAVFALTVLNGFLLQEFGFRFTIPKVNYAVFAVACLLPLLAYALYRSSHVDSRITAQTWLAPLMCGVAALALFFEIAHLVLNVVGFLFLDTVGDKVNPLQTIEWNGGVVSVWEDRAAEHKTFVVYQDSRVFGPVVRRRFLAEFPYAMEVNVSPMDKRHLRCKILQSGDPPSVREIVLLVGY